MIHAVMLLDESGSMGPVREDVIGGYKEYIKTLRKQEGETKLTLITFDLSGREGILHVKFIAEDLDNLPKLDNDWYQPHGSTPLNDAILETIKRIKKVASKDDDVIFIVYTDGYENCSKASSGDVKQAIAKREKKGWEFIYLGANQDAWSVGSGYGMTGLKINTSGTQIGTTSMLQSAANITNTARRSVGKGGTPAVVRDKYDASVIGETPIDEKKDDEDAS